MPITIESNASDAIDLEELVAILLRERVDTQDHESMIAAGGALRRLANNRTFLADMILKSVKDHPFVEQGASTYGPQVMILVPPTEPTSNFLVRANIWPAAADHATRASGPAQFGYHQPHDHCFNFLTVGYSGPGYRSNYYEYDYQKTSGYPGESVELSFIEQSCLHEGRVMLYRAFVDVHDQLPPESMSISINVMEASARGLVYDQYSFDVGKRVVTGIINPLPSSALMEMIAGLGDDDSQDFLVETAARHGKDRVRFAALKALASAAPSLSASVDILSRGTKDSSALISGWSAAELDRIERLQ